MHTIQTKEDILAAMVMATAAPRIPLWAALMAGPAMAGAEPLPQDLWEPLGNLLAKDAGDTESLSEAARKAGFTYLENHLRSGEHERWQAEAFGDLVNEAEAAGSQAWFVPVDELVCLSCADDGAVDFVTISRLALVGDERALREAVASLVKSLA